MPHFHPPDLGDSGKLRVVPGLVGQDNAPDGSDRTKSLVAWLQGLELDEQEQASVLGVMAERKWGLDSSHSLADLAELVEDAEDAAGILKDVEEAVLPLLRKRQATKFKKAIKELGTVAVCAWHPAPGAFLPHCTEGARSDSLRICTLNSSDIAAHCLDRLPSLHFSQ